MRILKTRSTGQAVVEFTLLLPLLATLALGVLDLGRAFHTHVALSNAARVGMLYSQTVIAAGNCSAAQPCPQIRVQDIIDRVKNEAQGGINTQAMSVTVCMASTPSCPVTDMSRSVNANENLTITASLPFHAITPFVPLTRIADAVTGSTFNFSVLNAITQTATTGPTATNTPIDTPTPVNTPTPVPANTPTSTATGTPTGTATPAPTPTAGGPPTSTPTTTSTPASTATNTPTAMPSPASSPTSTPTATGPTATSTPAPPPTVSSGPTAQDTKCSSPCQFAETVTWIANCSSGVSNCSNYVWYGTSASGPFYRTQASGGSTSSVTFADTNGKLPSCSPNSVTVTCDMAATTYYYFIESFPNSNPSATTCAPVDRATSGPCPTAVVNYSSGSIPGPFDKTTYDTFTLK